MIISSWPTFTVPVEPHHSPFHGLRHGLEDGDADDAASTQHDGLKGDVVEAGRGADGGGGPIKRLDET